ncbi:MAG: hypothetical protein WB784_01115 [Rhodanobacteraceae bacterium]
MTTSDSRFITGCLMLLALLFARMAPAGEPVALHTSDGVSVYGTLTRARAGNDTIILLFHQARGNHHEYDPVIPVLTKLGYDTLATDQRSGGNLFGGSNQTVEANGKSTNYLAALPDLEAALDWAGARHYRTIVTVGSSYSSSLVILLAARRQSQITALAAFSPGEYFDDQNLVKNAAAKITIPFFITTDPDEAGNVTEILSMAHGDNIVHYKQAAGMHGASTLVASRDPQGYEQNLQHFTAFLHRVADHDDAPRR